MNIFDRYLIEIEKEKLKDNRLKQQKQNNDYAYELNGQIEKCNDCGSEINSHDHCPRCDY